MEIFLQYLLSPAVAAAFIWFLLEKVYKLGELSREFKYMQEDIKEMKKEIRRISRHLDIIKTFLVSKHGLDASLFSEIN